ncbi:MAG TPA: YqiA/YcfP family alpha/beta fold hydrolase, partial [Thermoanaerobaculia bacterium]|nr:YqiA/YcfP family alpha/beta fold hydrolase [Thermoanaerobaculia bacterium]
MKRSVLYLHGFASSPGGIKVDRLRGRLEPAGIEIHAPDLNVPSFEKLSFEAMSDLALREGQRYGVAVIVGSSLGSLVALETVRRGLRRPLILIAPAIGVADLWLSWIGDADPVTVHHHGRDADANIHRAFFESVARLDVDRDPPPVPVTVIMGTADESIPFDRVQDLWKRWERSGRLVPGSRMIEISDGDHRLLDHLDRIADEIVGVTGSSKTA